MSRALRAAFVVALATTGIVGCSGPARRDLVVRVDAGPVAFDQQLQLTVSGADPAHTIRITATATDADGAQWETHADYTPTAAGTVDVRTSAASNGGYQGAHDGGLVWSLAAGPGHPLFEPGADGTMTETFTAGQDGSATASAQQKRWFRAPGVRVTSVDRSQAGFVGTMFSPAATAASTSAVLVLGGSEGGLSTSLPQARALASRGHPALAVAYFGLPGLPRTLARIPLEYFATALRWLARQPGVDPKRIVVAGLSRGSEAALLLGVDYPELVNSVAALSLSAVANPTPRRTSPAWTWHGRPVLTLPRSRLGAPVSTLGHWAIPVERIKGPVFLLCGDQDQLWRSCPSVQAMAGRLHGHPSTAISEPGAGHLVGLLAPDLPAASGTMGVAAGEETMGGTVQDDALGRLDAWPKLLAFLG